MNKIYYLFEIEAVNLKKKWDKEKFEKCED